MTARTTTRATALALLTVAATALPAQAARAAAAPNDAGAYTTDRTLRDSRIVESSGLSRSTYRRGLALTHNDSGDGPRVFAVGRSGATRAIFTLRGAPARDWEDMTAGRRHKIWVGDIGDNARNRSTISVLRFREPRTVRTRDVGWTKFDLRYEDGPRDAEALMVNPRTGRLFVISKESGSGTIYRAPRRLSTTRVNVLRKVGVDVPASVTGGTFAPGGGRFALSTYTAAYLYGSVKDRTARRVQLPRTRQGESVEFTRGGGALWRGSEGRNSPVYRVRLS